MAWRGAPAAALHGMCSAPARRSVLQGNAGIALKGAQMRGSFIGIRAAPPLRGAMGHRGNRGPLAFSMKRFRRVER